MLVTHIIKLFIYLKFALSTMKKKKFCYQKLKFNDTNYKIWFILFGSIKEHTLCSFESVFEIKTKFK